MLLLIQGKSVETATFHPPDIGGCEKRLQISLPVFLFLPPLALYVLFQGPA